MYKQSLSFRLTLLIGAMVFTVFTLTISYHYLQTRQLIIEDSKLKATNTVKQATSELITVINGVQKSTDFLASVAQSSTLQHQQLQRLIKSSIGSNSNIFGTAIALNPDFPGNDYFAPYYYQSNQGKTFTNLNTEYYRYTEQQWYTAAVNAEKPVWSEPYFDEGGGEQLMATYAVPIYKKVNGKDTLYAVITGDILLERIHDILATISLEGTGFAFLLSNKGLIISHPLEKNLLKHAESLINSEENKKQWQSIKTSILRGDHVSKSVNCLHKPGKCQLAYKPLPLTGWPLVVLFPETAMLQGLKSYTRNFIIISMIIVIILLTTIAIISQLTIKPVKLLATTADAIGRGDLSSKLPKKKNNDEVGQLITAFSNMQDNLAHHIKQLEYEAARKNRLKGELNTAHQIQMAMLPGNGTANIHHPQLSLWAHLIPARSVGGDFYQYQINDNKLSFAIGDVSDKGVSSAIFMARASSLIRQSFNDQQAIDKKVFILNNLLCENNEACMFVTLIYGVLDLTTGNINYICAGHSAPILINHNVIQELERKGGAALGLIENSSYRINHHQLRPQDKVFLYTDGIDEAQNESGEFFGDDSLLSLLEKNKDESVRTIGEICFTHINQFKGNTDLFDDTSIFTFEFKPRAQFLIHNSDVIHYKSFTLKPELQQISIFFEQLQRVSQELEFDSSLSENLKLCGEELINNAISYGKITGGYLIYWQIATTNQGVLFQLWDQGKPFNPLNNPPPTNHKDNTEPQIGGFGIHLVKNLTKIQTYRYTKPYNQLCIYLEIE